MVLEGKHTSGFVDCNGAAATFNSPLGSNWFAAAFAYLSHCPTKNRMTVVLDLCSTYSFTTSGSGSSATYAPQFGGPARKLEFDDETCRFKFGNCGGDAWYFSKEGDFELVRRSNGDLALVTERDAGGRPTRIQRSTTQDGRTVVDSVDYTYLSSGDNAGRVQAVTTRRSTNPSVGIRRMVYTYYSTGDEHGTAGDLRTATEQILSGTRWVDHDTSYYRYYLAGETNGFAHGIKYSLGPDAFARLQEEVGDPFLATNAQVAQYADNYYEYDADQRVTKSVVNGGLHTYTFSYEESAFSEDYNNWSLKSVQTRPDGSTLTRYNNFLGETMLTDLAEGSDHWYEYFQYDESLEVLHASPSAVISYDDSQADLDVTLQASSGLIRTTQYYSTTTATPTTPGGAAGYVERTALQEGTGGTPITQSEVSYFERTDGTATIYPLAESTVYRDDAGTEPIFTSFAYTWYSGTIQMEQRTTTLPVVPTAQNGANTTDTITEIFDELGNLIWRRDPRGFISYRAYDLPTGSVIQSIQDVDGAKLTLPSGWVTPAGGGLHLITDNEIDALGRMTQTLGPTHDVLGQSVRTASWMVYRDLEDETYSGQGNALGIGPEYEYTLVNPVSIQRLSHDGRVSQRITAVRDCAHEAGCECLVPEAGVVESAGRLSAGDCFAQSSWVRWSVSFTSNQDQLTSTRTYHHIPASGAGVLGVNYDETRYGYDLMGRQNRVVSATGTISRTVFDVRGLSIESWLGTDDRQATDEDPSGGGAAGNNMVQIAGMEYDGGSAGGDGNLTEQTAFVDGSTARVTSYEYDFRNRRTATDGEVDYFEELFYDNLNHVIQADRRNTNSGGNLIARSETLFDDRGRVYRTIRYGVDPATGTVGNSLTDNTWYDESGDVLCSLPAGSNAFTKSVYDGITRVIARYLGYNPDAEIDPSSVANDKIVEQSEIEYDGASNVLLTTSRQRFHNATGLGPLNGPSGSQPKSRDTFVAMWADGVGRTIASANYGTNDNAGPPERPDEPPEGSELILVSRTNYNERGEAFESIDPAGKVDRSYSDDAGRTVRTIQNYVAATEPGCFCPGAEQNVTTEMRYGPGSQLMALIAKNPETGDQVTQYQYGVTLADSDLASNDLLRSEVYPDSSDSTDRVTFTYNRQGQRTSMRDQNGSVHAYTYDLLGRQLDDAVPTLAAGVDGAILRIGRTYEVRGMVEKITSYDAAASGSVVNEVQNAFNDFAQLETQYQEHTGAVNTGTTPKVEYAYEDGSANTIRPTTMTYPAGQVLEDLYDDTDADNLSRIRTLNFDGDDVCQYTYLGMGTFVTTDYPQPQIKLDYASGSGANPYTGFDRFGRIIDLLWQSYASLSSSSSSSEEPPGLVHLQYTYDRASNRTSRADLIAQWYDKDFDELYEYDGMHRLKKFHRGRLVESDTVIESPTLQQGWRLDATGNWRNFTQNDQEDPAQTLDQQRLSNRVNEITQIARTVGANWVTPEYDRNGNMTVIPQPKDPTLPYRGTWDAWNRLVKLEEPDGGDGWQTLQENTYNGQTWRVIRKDYEDGSLSETRHFFYTSQWQDIEERLASDTDPNLQYVWGKRYIDNLILRDRDADDNASLDERLYALQDANWNVVATCTQETEVIERFAYLAYGNSAELTMSYISKSEGTWKIRYSGYAIDKTSSLYLVRFRYYSSSLGNWTSRDQLKGSPAAYFQYSACNPLNYNDPLGLKECKPFDPIGKCYDCDCRPPLASAHFGCHPSINYNALVTTWCDGHCTEGDLEENDADCLKTRCRDTTVWQCIKLRDTLPGGMEVVIGWWWPISRIRPCRSLTPESDPVPNQGPPEITSDLPEKPLDVPPPVPFAPGPNYVYPPISHGDPKAT